MKKIELFLLGFVLVISLIIFNTDYFDLINKITMILTVTFVISKIIPNTFFREVYTELSIEKYEDYILIILIGQNFYGYFWFKKIIDLYILIGLALIFIILLIQKAKKEKEEKQKLEKKISDLEKETFTQRKKDVKKIIEFVKNPKITTILFNSIIGSGKTYTIDYLLGNKQKNDYEIIYIKLPFIKDIEELKNILMNELQTIFKNNGVGSQVIKKLFKSISNAKFSIFSQEVELNLSSFSNQNLLETIREFKSKLKDMDKKILIILDDVERSFDINLIRDSIFFLGEFSEFFRDTKTTTIFLMDWNKVKDRITKSFNDIDLDLFHKYFKYVYEPSFKMNDLTTQDLKIFLPNEEEKKLEFLLNIIRFFCYHFNEALETLKIGKINTDIRTLEKILNKYKYLEYNLDEKKVYSKKFVEWFVAQILNISWSMTIEEKENFKKIDVDELGRLNVRNRYVLNNSYLINNLLKINLKIFDRNKIKEKAKKEKLTFTLLDILSDSFLRDKSNEEIELELKKQKVDSPTIYEIREEFLIEIEGKELEKYISFVKYMFKDKNSIKFLLKTFLDLEFIRRGNINEDLIKREVIRNFIKENIEVAEEMLSKEEVKEYLEKYF